jgi:glycosyltransferase involved in cell wall biosynthesis
MSTAVILVTTYLSYADDELQHGGRPRIVRELADVLRGLGFHVTIAQKGNRDAVIEVEPGIRVRKFRVPVRAWTDLLFALRTRHLVEAAHLCIYASCEDGYPFFSTRSIGLQHGIWWDKPVGSVARRTLINQIHLVRLLALCRRARRVICVDTNVINWLRLHGKPGHAAAAKCVYVPNYFGDEFVAPTADLVERRLKKVRLAFPRRFEEARGSLLFVEMCAKLRSRGLEFEASMIGWGSQEPHVRALAAERGLLTDVIRVSRGSFREVPELLRDATLTVIPSIYSEGTSLSAIESLAMGIPVIATDVGGLGNVVIPGFNGYLTKADPGDLAEAVMMALSSREHYTELVANCLQMRSALGVRRWRHRVLDILQEAQLVEVASAVEV